MEWKNMKITKNWNLSFSDISKARFCFGFGWFKRDLLPRHRGNREEIIIFVSLVLFDILLHRELEQAKSITVSA
jgi:hypothetical protein